MIPFPNAIAGILIGIANDSWVYYILAPFGWGVVFCVYKAIADSQRKEKLFADSELREEKAKWGMSHRQAFYLIEYATAVSTSLLFSVVTGVIKEVF